MCLLPGFLKLYANIDDIDPVSYTHLDVYKRQDFGWRNRSFDRPLGNARRFSGSLAAGEGFTAVSYTHLQYYAFISYKREDEKWAKWLQDRLRWYKLPSKLCRQITRLPKKVWPVFRDNTDLDSGRLEENIRHEL